MHHIYTTDSFILTSHPRGTGHKYLYLFTRDLGLVGATVQSVREIQSKLRYHLQDYAESSVSLVHGRSGWRVTGAQNIRQWDVCFKNDISKLSLIARLFSLLRRLLHGEEANKALFEIVHQTLEYLQKIPGDPQLLSSVEALVVLRVLHNLGYVGDVPVVTEFVGVKKSFDEDMVSRASLMRRHLIEHINHALRESHL